MTRKPEAQRLADGAFIGRFEVVRPLGRGGFGVVYQARDTELGRHVALKVMRTDRLGGPLLEMFQAEAEAAARLNHPNVVTLHDHGTQDGVPYLVLELLAGETLARRLQRGPLPAGEAVAVLVQICHGLAHAHRAGVIHRDLKPSNVFLLEDGQVKILDFGVARVEQSLAGATGGTPAYMAPEQWRGEAEDERADLFSCGVMLFEMLSGRLPHVVSPSGRSDLEETLAGVDARLPGVAPALVATTERALARDPRDRFASAQELLDALRQLAHPGALEGAQPYRFLDHFTEEDAAWFFGREREIVRLAQMLATHPLVALVGPSGAGKSSLVHAGLVPRLRRDGRWNVVTMRPGADPLGRLQERLAQACGKRVEGLAEAPGRAGRLLRRHARATGSSILLVVDQLEELVTQAPPVPAFARALLSIADDPGEPVRVVVALRDDFLVRLSKDANLREALARNLLILGPPDREGLAEALRAPAHRVGFVYEEGLVEAMVEAVADEAAPLPLLQLAASRLWERRDEPRRLLSRAGLEAAGGVAGILAAHATEILDGLDDGDLARRLLCDLVTDEGTRKRWRAWDVCARHAEPSAARRVLERLVTGRLVTSYRADGGEWVELAHESLITGWRQLRDWLDEDRSDRQFRERLLAAATLWDERRRATDLLWRGDTLDEALRWRRRYRGAFSQGEQAFLQRSERGLRRSRRWRRALVAATATFAVAGGVASVVTARASREVARQTRLAEMVRAAADDDDPLVGALVLAELQGQPEPPGGVAAAVKLAAEPIPMAVYRSPQPLITGALSPDGAWAAVTGGAKDRGDVLVWRVDGSGNPIVLHGHEKYAGDVSFSRDGRRIVTGSADWTARIWRADGTGEPIVLRHGAEVESVVFTPDDARVLTVASGEHVARLWRIDGQGAPVVFRHEGDVGTAAMSPDGAHVLTAGADGIRLWRADGTPLVFRAGETWGAQFSPDGSRVLSAHPGAEPLSLLDRARAGEMRVWRSDLSASILLPGARPPMVQMTAHAAVLPPSLWSPDGARVAHRTGDGAGVSRADGGGLLFELARGGGREQLIRFSPDGAHLLSLDGEAIQVWLDGGKQAAVLRGHGGAAGLTLGSFSSDGSRILTVSNDGSARVWRVGDPPGSRSFLEENLVTNLAVSPDGRLLLTTSYDGTARLWPVGGGPPAVLGTPRGYAASAGAFHPGGRRVAIAGNDGLEVWSVAGARLSRPIAEVAVGSVAYSRDGVWLAAVQGWSAPHHVTLLRADGSGEPVRRELPDLPFGVSFSPDSSRVALASFLGGRVWPADLTGEPVVLPVVAGLNQAVFHPRREVIMTSSRDDRVQFWTPDGRELVALGRPGGGAVAWSPDGERVAVGLRDGSVNVTRSDGRGEVIRLRGAKAIAFSPDGRLATSGGTVARLWLLDWGELVASLRAATTACLTPGQRIAHLDESPARAGAAFAACERRHGRAP